MNDEKRVSSMGLIVELIGLIMTAGGCLFFLGVILAIFYHIFIFGWQLVGGLFI